MTHGRIVGYKRQVQEAFGSFCDLLTRIEAGETGMEDAKMQLLIQMSRLAFILLPAILDEMDENTRKNK